MITLYHCAAARSFRALWTLEELGLPYDLKMLPFPPRVLAKEYLALNPLGTVPLLLDGDVPENAHRQPAHAGDTEADRLVSEFDLPLFHLAQLQTRRLGREDDLAMGEGYGE